MAAALATISLAALKKGQVFLQPRLPDTSHGQGPAQRPTVRVVPLEGSFSDTTRRPARQGVAIAVGTCALTAATVTAAASTRHRRNIVARGALAGWRGGTPPQSSLPLTPDGTVDYTTIDSSPVSQVLMGTVRSLLAATAGHDSTKPGYDGLMELVREVNDMEGTAEQLQKRARGVFEGILPSLFIGWIPPLWKQFIQPNVPTWLANVSFFGVFYLLFPWLMGPMEGEDFIEVELPSGLRQVFPFLPVSVQVPQSVKAERCRFLESANCASVCVNSCKVPSQEWLRDDFGMELHIQPNYDDFSCRWRFGKPAPPLMEDEAVMVPCFSSCPSKFKGTKDALSQREKLLRQEEDARLAKAVAELTPDGTALSSASLEVRGEAVGQAGKCWSVDEKRPERRAEAAAATA